MGLGARRLVLVVHITSSVGWIGAVATSLALAVVAVATDDIVATRAVYIVLEPMGRYVLMPLAVASFASGVLQSVGTRWGLFWHYWVIVKLLINVVSAAVLFTYLETLAMLATVARASPATDAAVLQDPSPVLHSAGALVLLLGATVLSVYKPRGMTRYGQRQAHALRRDANAPSAPSAI